MKKKLGVLVLLLAFALVTVGCDNTTTSSSKGGASLVFGLVDEAPVAQPSTTFRKSRFIMFLIIIRL